MRYLLLLLFAVWPLCASAVVFDEHTRMLPLGQAMQVFEDVRGDATIDEVTSPALQASFRRHDNPVLNAGYSRSVFWLRLDLEYRPQRPDGPQPWLLELAYPPLDRLDLYLADGQGKFQLAQRTGDALPFVSAAGTGYSTSKNLPGASWPSRCVAIRCPSIRMSKARGRSSPQ